MSEDKPTFMEMYEVKQIIPGERPGEETIRRHTVFWDGNSSLILEAGVGPFPMITIRKLNPEHMASIQHWESLGKVLV